MWSPNRSDTNQAVQSQKQARSLKFWIKNKRKCTLVSAKLICVFDFAYADCWLSYETACIFSNKHNRPS